MKTKSTLSVYCILVVSIVILSAFRPAELRADQLTNRLFRTVPFGQDFSGDVQDMRDMLLQKPVGKFGHEILPATEDPQGNWGEITNGLQMSIRFYQNNFTNGQPVAAVILWRNVGPTPQYFDFAAGVEYYPFDLFVHCNGAVLKPLTPRFDPKWREHSHGGSNADAVEPGTQVRAEQRLDTIF